MVTVLAIGIQIVTENLKAVDQYSAASLFPDIDVDILKHLTVAN